MIRMCYILRNNVPQSELTCLGYRVLWNSHIFRGGELLVRKGLVQVSDKYPGICLSIPLSTVKPCHHSIQEQSQGDCRSPFWPCVVCGKGVGANSIQCTDCCGWVHKRCSGARCQKPSEISGEGTSNLSC